MIDDFTNAWHSVKGTDRADFGGDWGGMHGDEGSSVQFLKTNLLDIYPQIRTVFFTILSRLGPFLKDAAFTWAEAFDHSKESIDFLRGLQFNRKFEIAYHGYNHGIPGEKKSDFIQEWESFSTLEEAVGQNGKGRELHRSILGRYPEGGKYGGWRYNDLADESIERSGFVWWCRDWMPRDTKGSVLDEYYELQYFGGDHVVAIPTTVHGHHWERKEIDTLLKNRQVISIEEHIAKIKPGSPDQMPNIFDDMRELKRLFGYLRKKNVWYASCGDIASYFIGYRSSDVYDVKKQSFKMEYRGRVNNPWITVFMDSHCICSDREPYIQITLPNGSLLAGQQYQFQEKGFIHKIHIPVMNGEYHVSPATNPPKNLRGKIAGDRIEYEPKGYCGHVKLPYIESDHSFYLYEQDAGRYDYMKYDDRGFFETYCLDSSKDNPLIDLDGFLMR
jgi:hypothetical protein